MEASSAKRSTSGSFAITMAASSDMTRLATPPGTPAKASATSNFTPGSIIAGRYRLAFDLVAENVYLRRRLKADADSAGLDVEARVSDAPLPDEALDIRRAGALLDEALATLDEFERSVFVLAERLPYGLPCALPPTPGEAESVASTS